MIKKVVIAGCRDYNDYDEAKSYIDVCLCDLKKENEIVILSGGATGADALGERYAKENGLLLERHPADWKTYGKRAGPLRNEKNGADVRLCNLLLGREEQRNKVDDRVC